MTRNPERTTRLRRALRARADSRSSLAYRILSQKRRSGDGVLRVEGGRVLTVTAVATTFREAQQLSHDTADAIEFDGKLFRTDIGWREAARLEERRPATVRRG